MPILLQSKWQFDYYQKLLISSPECQAPRKKNKHTKNKHYLIDHSTLMCLGDYSDWSGVFCLFVTKLDRKQAWQVSGMGSPSIFYTQT